MAKKQSTIKVDVPAVTDVDEETAPFDYGIFTRSVDKICLGDGVQILSDKAREAIADAEKVTISPYALLGLITSWQSLQQEAINLLTKQGVKPAEAQKQILRAISIEGIKEKIEDEKAQREIEREAAKSERKKGRR